jgi:hypothetical protein
MLSIVIELQERRAKEAENEQVIKRALYPALES